VGSGKWGQDIQLTNYMLMSVGEVPRCTKVHIGDDVQISRKLQYLANLQSWRRWYRNFHFHS